NSGAASTPTRSLHGARRVPAIDALRGLAVALMIVYHFSFDLRYYGLIGADFEHDPFWLGVRGLIVSLFILLVGVSLVLPARAGLPLGHFCNRCAVIAVRGLAAPVGSYLLFPQSFIYFGILHCIVAASILARPLVERPRTALAIGVAIIVAGLALSHPVF